MNYREKMQASKGKAANHLLGTKIRDLMNSLRMGNAHNASRRWIWELLQNAKDVAYEDQPVSIQVELHDQVEGRAISFRHNGKPFTMDNIYFLIQQVSTKEQESTLVNAKKSTGKFGTGFLSTHLLSEKVTVNGVIKDEELPYKKFTVTLDRSPRDIVGIIESVEKSLDAIAVVLDGKTEFYDFQPALFNTSFTYLLEAKKEDLAKIGVTDLHYSLPYTMAFSDDILQVEVVHDDTTYQVVKRENFALDGMELVTIKETSLLDELYREIIVCRSNIVTIAIEMERVEDRVFKFKQLDYNIPRLFCDFPLIGTEDFPFPVVVNSSEFNPTEPRNGVWLSHKDEPEVIQNEQIINEAIVLYNNLLSFASRSGYKNMFEIARIRPTSGSNWLSSDWFDQQVLRPIRAAILTTRMVDTLRGRVSFLGSENDKTPVWFPLHEIPEIQKQIWRLANQWIPQMLPPEYEVEQWSSVIWDECNKLTLNVIAKSVHSKLSLKAWAENLNTNIPEAVQWLNQFYSLAAKDEVFENFLINNQFNIFPNQEGIFKKREELFLDKDMEVEDSFKEVARKLGVNNWALFLDNRIKAGSRINFNKRDLQYVLNDINTRLKDSKISLENRQAAAVYLVTLFSPTSNKVSIRIQMHKFTEALYPQEVSQKKQIKSNNLDIWKEADPIHIRAMVRAIAEHKNLTTLCNALHLDSEMKTLEWLNDFVAFLKDTDMSSQLNLEKHPILPNQHGSFCTEEALYLDASDYETLKDISAQLGYDYRSQLLNKAIFLALPSNRELSNVALATNIATMAMQHTSKLNRPGEIKTAFRLLIQFFLKHPEESQTLFGDLYYNKHKLYDDSEIASNLQKVEEVNNIMADFGIENIEDLRSLIQKGINANGDDGKAPKKKQVTKELLASWGVTTPQEYERLVGEDVNNAIFHHYSKPDPELYKYSQDIIERARENIVRYLQSLPQYDCVQWESLAPTVIGGIKKLGRHVNIVFRPSDGMEVIFYYPAEYSTLDEDNTELWVEDGITDPIFLTLGKILKVTGINRIPIHGITSSI